MADMPPQVPDNMAEMMEAIQRAYIPVSVFGGVRNEADVRTVTEAMGMFFAFDFRPNSPNYIEPARATAARTAVGLQNMPIGIFFNEPVDNVAKLHTDVCITIALLNGSEDNAYIAALKERVPLLAVWKNFIIRGPEDLQRAAESNADMVVLSSPDPSKPFDWGLIPAGFRAYVLYGGITRMNVRNIIMHLEPYGVFTDFDTDEMTPEGTYAKSTMRVREFLVNVGDGARNAKTNEGNPVYWSK